MAKRKMSPTTSDPWLLQRDPSKVRFAFFISHVAEDASEVAELKSEIDAYSGRPSRGNRPTLDCFLDIHSWPTAKRGAAVICEKLLETSYFVFWVTPAYLKNERGWVWMELAYAELIEESANLRTMDHQPYIVPVFRRIAIQDVERTPLLAHWQENLGRPDIAVKEIAQRLVDFYDQELPKREAK